MPWRRLRGLPEFGKLFHSHEEPLFSSGPWPLTDLIRETEPRFTHRLKAVSHYGSNLAAHPAPPWVPATLPISHDSPSAIFLPSLKPPRNYGVFYVPQAVTV